MKILDCISAYLLHRLGLIRFHHGYSKFEDSHHTIALIPLTELFAISESVPNNSSLVIFPFRLDVDFDPASKL